MRAGLIPEWLQENRQPNVQKLQELESTVKHLEEMLLENKSVIAPGQGSTSGNLEGYDDLGQGYPTKSRPYGPYQESVSTRSPFSTPCHHSSASIGLTSHSSKHKVPPLNLGNRKLSTVSGTSSTMDSRSSGWQGVNVEDFPLPISHRLRAMRRIESARLHPDDSVASFLSLCDSARQMRTLRPQELSTRYVTADLPLTSACETARREHILHSQQAPPLDGAGPTPKQEGYVDGMGDTVSIVDMLQSLYRRKAQGTQRRLYSTSLVSARCPHESSV